MALIEVIKYNASSDDEFVWKFPSEDLKLGAQLIVNEGQEALFAKGGIVLDIFSAGTHTLQTANIPLLNKILNLPFGGSTPFSAEIWFVNKTVKRDLKWGTPVPILLMDPVYGFPVSVRSFGKWGVKICDTRAFMTQIIGSQISANSEKIKNYFIGEIIQRLTGVISSAIIDKNLSIMTISASLNELSEYSKKALAAELIKYGIDLVNFNIESINIPDEEIKKFQNVFAKKMEVSELSKVSAGGAYGAVKSFEVMNNAASNQNGSLGTFLGAGIGIGAGVPLGQQFAQQIGGVVQQPVSANVSSNPVEKLKKLKDMLDQGLITEEIFNSKRDQILGEL
jgi:membrane protease subunit (stomatin/prohibitin family)